MGERGGHRRGLGSQVKPRRVSFCSEFDRNKQYAVCERVCRCVHSLLLKPALPKPWTDILYMFMPLTLYVPCPV